VPGDVVGQNDGIAGRSDKTHPTGARTQLHLRSGHDPRILEGGDELGVRLDWFSDTTDDGRGGPAADSADPGRQASRPAGAFRFL